MILRHLIPTTVCSCLSAGERKAAMSWLRKSLGCKDVAQRSVWLWRGSELWKTMDRCLAMTNGLREMIDKTKIALSCFSYHK